SQTHNLLLPTLSVAHFLRISSPSPLLRRGGAGAVPAAVGSVAAGDGNAPPGHRSPAVNFSGRGAAPPPSTTTLVRPPHWSSYCICTVR
ncbi:Os02g0582200, partial [Oryza sativa Japonica Group]